MSRNSIPFLKFLLSLTLAICLTSCGAHRYPKGHGRVVFSPDGENLLLAVYSSRGSGIYRMERNWSHAVRLTTHHDSHPAYSPDGLKIAFIREWDVYLMNADGTNQTRLTGGPDEDRAPVFSPDGQRIYFERSLDKPSPRYEVIYSVGSDGSSIQRAMQDDYISLREFSISPDGERAVVAGPKSGEDPWRQPPVLHLISLETGREIGLIPIQLHIEQYLPPTVVPQYTVIGDSTYSPDGKAIIFVAQAKLKNRAGDWITDSMSTLYRLTLESGTIERISNTESYYIRWPSVSPDGKTITFCAGIPYDCEYYWMDNVEGGHPHQIELDAGKRK